MKLIYIIILFVFFSSESFSREVLRKVVINKNQSSNYEDTKISVSLLVDQGINERNDNCKDDDLCTNDINFTIKATDSLKTICNSVENYSICIRRSQCSKLYYEYQQAKKNLQLEDISTHQFHNEIDFYKNDLINLCNRLFLVENNNEVVQFGNIFYTNYANDKAYGWFNEACIIKGFNYRLKKVLAHRVNNGNTRGKCIIDHTKSSDNDCSSGGKKPECVCTYVGETMQEVNNTLYEIREETLREAGLCVDLDHPVTCKKIGYRKYSTSQSQSDYNNYYVTSSLNKESENEIDESHIQRTRGQEIDDEIIFHSEFDSAMAKMEDIEGSCNGFWTYKKNDIGLDLKPIMNCLENGKWDKQVRNDCERYSCKKLSTKGMDKYGSYEEEYAIEFNYEDKGFANGFANWPSYNKTNDLLEIVEAESCIPGFKPKDSVINSDNEFVNGILPTRSCNQIGAWLSDIENRCERVLCPTIDEATLYSGGAIFPSVKASRSKDFITEGSTAEGECDVDAGFFLTPGGEKPTMGCNYLGQWEKVQNPCVTECEAIEEDYIARNYNNGYSFWDKIFVPAGSNSVKQYATSCVNGYVKNPYSDNRNHDPSVLLTNRHMPYRECTLLSLENGDIRQLWQKAQNSCVDKCPGSSENPTIGIGKTREQTVNGFIIINWPATDLGKYAYMNNNNQLFAGHFYENRFNGYYQLRRKCNSDGKWGQVEPLCVVNNANNNSPLGNAVYKKPGTYSDLLLYASFSESSTPITGECKPGFEAVNNTRPVRKCVRSNYNVDQTYLKLVNSTSDCEEITCDLQASTEETEILGLDGLIPIFDTKYISQHEFDGENAGYVGQNKTLSLGEEIDLTCLNKTTYVYGHKPVAKCERTGLKMINSNVCKKSCEIDSYNSVLLERVDANGCANGSEYKVKFVDPLYRMKHGEYVNFSVTDTCGVHGSRDCHTWDYYARCENGIFTPRSIPNADYYEGDKTCGFKKYDPESKNWGPLEETEFNSTIHKHKTEYKDYKNRVRTLDFFIQN